MRTVCGMIELFMVFSGILKCMPVGLCHDEVLLTTKDRIRYAGGPGAQ